MKEKINNLLNNKSGRFAYYVEDIESGEVVKSNENIRFHAASMIKLFYLYEALKQVDSGILNLNDKFEVKSNDPVGGSGALKLMHVGLEVTLRDLLNLMIQISDNTATNMLFDILGKDNINKSLKDLGINETFIARKLMIVEENLYSYSTANDIAMILKEFYNPTKLTKNSSKIAMEILYNQQYNESLSYDLILCGNCNKQIKNENICPYCNKDTNNIDPKEIKFAHKTGSIQGVIHDGGILTHNGKAIIIVLLTDNLKNNQDGVQIQRAFGNLIYDNFFN